MTDTTPAVRIVPGRGHMHTALMDLIHSELMRQFPGSLVEEDGNASIAIHSPKPYLTIDVSALAEAALAAALVAPGGEGAWGGSRDEALLHGLYARLLRTAPSQSEAQAFLQRQEALALRAVTDFATAQLRARSSPDLREGVEPEAGAVARKVTIGPDAANSNNRRLSVDGSQWAKVYGWDAASVEARCNALKAAIEAHPTPADDRLGVARAFAIGDRVTKTKGSSWTGKVVGFYSTALTPEGYAVESETEVGSVQIYPVRALALLTKSGEAGE